MVVTHAVVGKRSARSLFCTSAVVSSTNQHQMPPAVRRNNGFDGEPAPSLRTRTVAAEANDR